MKVSRSACLLALAAGLLLTACGKSDSIPPIPTAAGLMAALATQAAGATAAASSPTPHPTPTPTATPTPPPCPTAHADYCLLPGDFYLLRPIAPPGNDLVDRIYPYGSTELGRRVPHHGVEFYNPSGTPVLAVAAGRVYFAGDDHTTAFAADRDFYGNLIILEHDLSGRRLYSLYAHLSRIDVSTGQVVRAGQVIGQVGATGTASGSHLHFEVRFDPQTDASAVNPELWLLPHPGNGVLALRFQNRQGAFAAAKPNIQFYPDPHGSPANASQPEAYAAALNNGMNWENVLLGDLPAGDYRLTVIWAGTLVERWVRIEPGKLTRAEFQLP
jgi:murein DD-endopeptidase MepM/ murein hydrolase activator NlpD